MRIAVLGQGYVGLPLAMRAVEVGHEVLGIDVDPARALALKLGQSFIEDISDKQLQAAIASGLYRVDTELAEYFDYAIITVPTPLQNGLPDTSYVESAAASVAKFLRSGATVILESTSYPGTTEDVVRPILEGISELEVGEFHLGFSSERIDPGNKDWSFQTTPKLASGCTERCTERVLEFYRSVCDTVIPVSSPKAAELAKVFENLFRSVNIALVNELAQVAHDLDVSVWDVLDAADSKPFGFMRFQPGPGIGGHCLPVDPVYLAYQVEQELGRPFKFIRLAEEINSNMPAYVVKRINTLLNDQQKSVRGAKILVLGLAYKADTSDIRESPALTVVDELLSLGADVRASDPHVAASNFPALRFDHNDCSGFDVVVLLTDHTEFEYDKIQQSARVILDTRHKFQPVTNVVYL